MKRLLTLVIILISTGVYADYNSDHGFGSSDSFGPSYQSYDPTQPEPTPAQAYDEGFKARQDANNPVDYHQSEPSQEQMWNQQ